jgi:hypothetical protein
MSLNVPTTVPALLAPIVKTAINVPTARRKSVVTTMRLRTCKFYLSYYQDHVSAQGNGARLDAPMTVKSPTRRNSHNGHVFCWGWI